jgi:hypothetical protein
MTEQRARTPGSVSQQAPLVSRPRFEIDGGPIACLYSSFEEMTCGRARFLRYTPD